MNAHQTIKPATVTRDPLAPRGNLTMNIDMATVRAMSAGELFALRDVLHTVCTVVYGLNNASRFASEDVATTNNVAGTVLFELCEFLSTYEQACINVVTALEPKTVDEAEERSWTILGFEADMRESLETYSAMAATAVMDVADVRRQLRR